MKKYSRTIKIHQILKSNFLSKTTWNRNKIINYNYEYIRTIQGKVKHDPEVKKIVDFMDAKIADKMDKQIGVLKTAWDRRSNRESNIGNWFTDAIKEHFKTDIAFQNSGGIRKDLSAGPITIRDVWEISPFANTIEIIKVRGDTLKQMMQWRVRHSHDLLQTSGMKRVYNSKTDSLLELTVNGKKIEKHATYTIATNNYITGHAKRFFGIPASELNIKYTGIVGRDVLIEDIKDKETIHSEVEGRIIDVANK